MHIYKATSSPRTVTASSSFWLRSYSLLLLRTADIKIANRPNGCTDVSVSESAQISSVTASHSPALVFSEIIIITEQT